MGYSSCIAKMKNCLDYFLKADEKKHQQFNLTFDDIRMIPDIVENYDSVVVRPKNKGYRLEFTKRYGSVEYQVVEVVGSIETTRATCRKRRSTSTI